MLWTIQQLFKNPAIRIETTLMTKEALLIVDVQYDFLEGGSLAVPNGNDVIPEILRIAPNFETIILTQDWHPPGHKSFASSHVEKKPFDQIEWHGKTETLWPDHCVQNKKGAEIHPKILALNPSLIVQKGTDLEIDSYSAFFDNDRKKKTGLDGWLKENEIQKLTICGLATDFCVKFTALDALDLGYKVSVFAMACKAVNFSDEPIAFQEMEKSGAIPILRFE